MSNPYFIVNEPSSSGGGLGGGDFVPPPHSSIIKAMPPFVKALIVFCLLAGLSFLSMYLINLIAEHIR